MLVAHVMTEKSRHRSKSTRVIVGIEHRAIERGFAPIKTYAGPRLLQSVAQIVFACDEIDCPGLGLVRGNEIHESIERFFYLSFCDLGQSLAVVFFEIGIHHTGHDDSRSPATTKIKVLPIGMFGGHFLLDAGSSGRIFESIE